jgi:ankyrin repeat protein
MKILSIKLSTSFALLVSISVTAFAQSDIRLIDAVEKQDMPAFRAVLDQRVNVNMVEADGTTALHWAAHRNNIEMVNALLEAGADVAARNRYGVAPLSLAAVNGNADMLKLLLDAGADPSTSLAENETVLMTASRTGVVEAVQLLLEYGADVNAKESWRGQTALMWAAGEGNLEVAQILLDHGAEVQARSDRGFTPLLFASREGHVELIRPLLRAGAKVDETLPARESVRAESGESAGAKTGITPLLLASGSAHFELAALLLEEGADPNQSPLGWTALHQLSWVRKAGQAGSNNPAPEGSGSLGSLEFARKLVEHGAELNARVTERPPAGVTDLNMKGGTPFLLAARTADVELMSLLAELGADPLMPNENYSTPLMVAAGLGTAAPGEDPGTELEVLEAVKLALVLGGDINAVNDHGETAMHGAAYKHVPQVVQLLADSGAEISIWYQENEQGWTPLTITQGVHRGMSIVSSLETEVAIQKLLNE